MTSSPPGTPGAGIFSLRIVSLDCYMASPIPGLDFSYSDFQGREVEEVPVIRIFGSTPVGQKTCMHVHRALPYLYIPCPEIFLQNSEEGHAYINVLSLAIEKALSVTNNSASKRQHVHGCNIVRAKRIYGCHMSEELFLKIYLYYPFEVARLATLLLGGAVLNRSFQPYESHIPYLLQFLIDYNLYGMSHVHTSKVKFRPPMPDSFLPAATGCSQQYTSEESSNGAAGSSSVWLSSTVADALIWPVLSTGNNLLEDKIIHLVKRQSVCALEVDSSAEDIVNQGYKMYTSLSQTQSDVKMVQSLIPIWEEEYERSGLQEVTKSPDSSKPLPEHALEHFLYGLEYEKTLSKLSALAHNSSPEVIPAEEEEQLDKYIKCFTDIGQSVRFVEHLMSSNPDEPLRHSKGKVENVSMPSRSFVGEDEHAAAYSKKNGFQGLGSGMRTGDSKVIDTEALGLLNWLASSQAIEELNTDDELVHEAILSPIFPTKSYNQALEMAHLNYESASQQECQDILDTIYDVQKSDGLEEQHPCPSVSISSCNVIPQFDGSFDDQLSLPNEGEISDQNLNGREKYIRHQEGKCSNTMVGAETRTDKLLSGMLPLSPKQKDYEGSRGGTHNSPHEDEMKIDSESRSSGRKHAWSYSASKVGTEVSDGKGGYKMGKCSVRELMRRKRYFRSDQLESQSGFTTTSTVMQGNEMMAGYPEWSILHSEERNNHTMPGETVQVEKSHFTEGKFVDKYLQETLVDASSSLDPDYSENQLVADAEDPTTNQDSAIALDELGLCERHFCSDAEQISAVDANIVHPVNQLATSFSPNTLSNVLTEEFSEECTEMTWRRKPPSEGQIDLTSEEFTASVTKAIGVTGDEKQRIRDLPPFFNGKVVDRVQENHTTNNDYAFGVPVHFQNDGTALYLLTYASSPPTSESIQEWLSARIKHNNLRNDTGDFCHTMPPVSYPTQPLISELFQSSQTHRNLEPENCSSHVNVVSSEPRPSCRHMKENVLNSSWHESSQISGPTEKLNLTAVSQIGFRDPASFGGGQQLTIISIEVHAESRGDLQPDPQFDAINVVALAIEEDRSRILDVHVLICSNDKKPDRRNLDGVKNCNLAIFPEEQQLLRNLLKIIASYDPDILMGWDIQRGSLGFLAERAAYLGISLLKNLSRTPALETDLRFCHPVKFEEGTVGVSSPEKSVAGASLQDVIIEDEWGRNHASGIHVGGRIVLNVWRLMRSELKLNMYTVEAVAEEVLRRKIPSISCRILNNWFLSGLGRARYKCIEYVVERAKLNIQIMNQLDMINRTSELARVFGIDFFSVLSRGSQFRVESMLLRLAHTQNYLALSPGSQQVATQPAMECLPLVMEPESGYYTDPVVVLDFQSLYPSMIIAYNLCFCTCLGKVFPAKANVLGVSSYSVDGKILKEFKRKILLTPNGVMYAPPKVRKGVLPRLLEEILSTRIMVKNAMKKLSPSQKVLQRIFNARQLALKLIANVTYGYTAAGFSGRMPCAELADSIVQCGRSTLETAISFVNNHDKWKAKVVYGDTDSMFVLLKGRSVKEAFRIGNEIAAAITAMNPDPVALKMEKVYHSCFLLTKKRYVGFSYESPDQEEPKFDAKGIETVRRDTCPAVTKTLERSIRIIFEHRSISRVRSYLERQWARILSGKVSLQDFVFAKEVRLDTYSARAASLPPAAIVATKAMRADPRAKPNYGERIPYVVIHGEPGARLIDMVVDPLELLEIDSPFRLNDLYYINKQIIPALQRVFGLVGADLNQWFSEMPRPIRSTLSKSQSYVSHFGSLPNFDDKRFESSKKAVAKSRIDTYYISKHCSLCGELVQASAFVCPNCAKNGSLVVNFVVGKTSKREREMHHLVAICRHCGGDDWIVESGVKCTSLACAVFYERRKVQKELQALSCFATAAGFYPSCMAEKF